MRSVSLTLQQAADNLTRHPTQKVYLDLDRDGVYEVEVTADVESISDNHELQASGGQKRGLPSVDQATVTLYNEHGYYSPHNGNSPYNGYIVAGVGIKILAGFNDEYVPVFTGIVVSWNPSRKNNTCVVKCKDKAYYMQRKDAEDVLLINISMKDAVERLVNWTFGVGKQAMEVDNIPIIIPALELESSTKVWNYIQSFSLACDAKAYFDGDGIFHFHSKLAVGYQEDTTPTYWFTSDKLFALDEEFDQTAVVNKWIVTSKYLTVYPQEVVWGTPDNFVEVTESYIVGDTTKNAIDVVNKTIQLKTKPEGATSYENTWNLPLRYELRLEGEKAYPEGAFRVFNVTKSIELNASPDENDAIDAIYFGLIHLAPDAVLDDGDLIQVTYTYQSRRMQPNAQRTWYAELSDKTHNIQPLEFAANDSSGNSILCSTQADTPNSLCVQEYTILSPQKVRFTLKNNMPYTVIISTLQIKGEPVRASSPLTAVCVDDASVQEYGELESTIESSYITSEDYIQKIAAFLCDRTKRPRSIVQADIKGLPQLELGDRVRITDDITGLDFDFIVTAITDKWSNQGWMADISLEQADETEWKYEDGLAKIVNRAGGLPNLRNPIAPAIPQNLQCTLGKVFKNRADLILTWDAVPDPQLDHYNVYCLFPDADDYQYIGRTAGVENSFVHSSLALGEPHSYRVSSVNQSGVESEKSVVFFTSIGDSKRPATPTNQQAKGGMDYIAVSWNEVTTNYDGTEANDIDKYRVYMFNGSGYEKLVEVPHPDTHFVHGGLNHSTSYSYKITCVDVNGNESDMPSTAAVGTTLTPDTSNPTAPNPPTNIMVYGTFRSFALTWDAPTSGPPIDYYIVEYITSTNHQSTWDPNGWKVHPGRVGSTYFVHTGLNPELDYKYRIKSVSVGGVASTTYSSEKIAGRPDKVDLGNQVNGTMTLTDSIAISSGRMLIDQNGLKATNQVNEETIFIDSTTGNARFAGTVQAKELLIPVRSA